MTDSNTPDISREVAEEELKKNYAAFSKMQFRQEQRGHFALLQDCKLISVLDTRNDAYIMGRALFEKEGRYFSVQQIMPPEIDLGIQSYALHTD